jgi:hypothetical protein
MSVSLQNILMLSCCNFKGLISYPKETILSCTMVLKCTKSYFSLCLTLHHVCRHKNNLVVPVVLPHSICYVWGELWYSVSSEIYTVHGKSSVISSNLQVYQTYRSKLYSQVQKEVEKNGNCTIFWLFFSVLCVSNSHNLNVACKIKHWNLVFTYLMHHNFQM